tara:strand:+ start:619 stop:867 length:249 start_codon:yes stop_codon:yes gene_type:complete
VIDYHRFNASSVHLPEIVIPSADLQGLSPEFYSVSVLLPESFRGGCSFGLETGGTMSPDALFIILKIKKLIKKFYFYNRVYD